ncbi:MAG: nucleotidyl transferase AbiEii/AbiGii toxin family protein [Planctomycetota bacterium]
MLTSVEQLLVRVSKALDKAGIPYMVIGGQAVLLYGTPRLTKDIDITLGVDVDQLPQVLAIVKQLNLKILKPNYRDFVTRTMVLPLADTRSNFHLDFIFSFTAYEHQAIKRVKKVRFGRVVVRFASLEDIIIHKIFSSRPKDIEDVRSIIARHPKYDRRYVRKWLKEFDLAPESGGRLLKTFNGIILE